MNILFDKYISYLALLKILVGNHEVAELWRGSNLVGQRLADWLVQLPISLLAVAVAVVHLVLQRGYASFRIVTKILLTCLQPVHLVVATLPHFGQAPLSSGSSSIPPIIIICL